MLLNFAISRNGIEPLCKCLPDRLNRAAPTQFISSELIGFVDSPRGNAIVQTFPCEIRTRCSNGHREFCTRQHGKPLLTLIKVTSVLRRNRTRRDTIVNFAAWSSIHVRDRLRPIACNEAHARPRGVPFSMSRSCASVNKCSCPRKHILLKMFHAFALPIGCLLQRASADFMAAFVPPTSSTKYIASVLYVRHCTTPFI